MTVELSEISIKNLNKNELKIKLTYSVYNHGLGTQMNFC